MRIGTDDNFVVCAVQTTKSYDVTAGNLTGNIANHGARLYCK